MDNLILILLLHRFDYLQAPALFLRAVPYGNLGKSRFASRAWNILKHDLLMSIKCIISAETCADLVQDIPLVLDSCESV